MVSVVGGEVTPNLEAKPRMSDIVATLGKKNLCPEDVDEGDG